MGVLTFLTFLFQSAPLTKARGDVNSPRSWPSIHSFNPLPSQKQGETSLAVRGARRCPGFNPLPSQKQGETGRMYQPRMSYSVSIRSPHKSKGRHTRTAIGSMRILRFNPLPSQKQGETYAKFAYPDESYVSIRSPHKSKGRRHASGSVAASSMFQSAPLTKARGDFDAPKPASCPFSFNPLPSQKQGETGCRKAWNNYQLGFNPLPSQKQGETRRGVLVPLCLSCFNPLPSQKQGETGEFPPVVFLQTVSIRSPHKSKGRHYTSSGDHSEQ